MFRFENISAFQYLILVPLFWILSFVFQKIAQKKMARQLGARGSIFLTQSISANKRRWKQILQSVTVLLLVLSLARPQLGQSQEKIKSEGIEIMLLVDVSESMMSEDLKPNRLEQAKLELSKLVDLSPGHKIGVIAFAGSAALLSPLTNDPAAVKMYIESLSTSSVSSQGTNFEDALNTAVDSFERGGVSSDESSKATRVILIASDGEDHEQGALNAAQKLTEKGFRIFTLAYGTEKGGAIPVRDAFGYMKGYKKDRQGQTILSVVNGQFLQKLSQEGKGSFYFSVFGGDHVQKLNEDFSKLEKVLFESQFSTQYEEKFQLILIFAFIFGLLEAFLGDRKSQARIWRGRFEVGAS